MGFKYAELHPANIPHHKGHPAFAPFPPSALSLPLILTLLFAIYTDIVSKSLRSQLGTTSVGQRIEHVTVA